MILDTLCRAACLLPRDQPAENTAAASFAWCLLSDSKCQLRRARVFILAVAGGLACRLQGRGGADRLPPPPAEGEAGRRVLFSMLWAAWHRDLHKYMWASFWVLVVEVEGLPVGTTSPGAPPLALADARGHSRHCSLAGVGGKSLPRSVLFS